MLSHVPQGFVRILRGVGAFVLVDVITGMAAFSVIVLSSFWFFSIGWLTLTQEYAARGLAFGSAVQSDLAWVGVLGALPMVAPTLYLAFRAYRLPYALFRASVSVQRPGGSKSPSASTTPRGRLRLSWAKLRGPRSR